MNEDPGNNQLKYSFIQSLKREEAGMGGRRGVTYDDSKPDAHRVPIPHAHAVASPWRNEHRQMSVQMMCIQALRSGRGTLHTYTRAAKSLSRFTVPRCWRQTALAARGTWRESRLVPPVATPCRNCKTIARAQSIVISVYLDLCTRKAQNSYGGEGVDSPAKRNGSIACVFPPAALPAPVGKTTVNGSSNDRILKQRRNGGDASNVTNKMPNRTKEGRT